MPQPSTTSRPSPPKASPKPKPPRAPGEAGTRDRLLRAGAELLDAAKGGDVSTRAICDLAGVQAPTLYHHFGNKQALLDEVVSHGFRSFLAARADTSATTADPTTDPIDDIRRGWDDHVAFGLRHPTFYAHVYGTVKPGVPCGVVASVEAMVLDTLDAAARQGRLTVAPAVAASEIVAASSGVILTLITQPPGEADLGLSTRVRDAILRSITIDDATGGTSVRSTSGAASAHASAPSAASAAIALTAALDDDASRFTPGEATLLRELLARLS